MEDEMKQAIADVRAAARKGTEHTARAALECAADALEEAMLWIGAPVTGVAVPLILAKLGYDEEPEKSELYKKLDTELGFHLSSAHREQIIGIVEKLVAEELAKSATSSNHGLRYRAVSNGILVGPERGDAEESLEDLKKFLSQNTANFGDHKGFIQFSEAGNSGLWQTYVKNLTYWDIVNSQGPDNG